MNKKISCFLLLMLVFLFVPGCNKKHTHDYEDATCTQPKICTICGQTEGDPLGHTYDNDCDDICNVCGETRIVQHQFIDATCEEPKTCTACGKQEGQALGHLWVDATFEEAKTCSRCGKIEGDDVLTEALKEFIPQDTSTKLDLPSSILGYDVTWTSLDKDVMLDDGVIIASDTKKIAQLQAEIKIDTHTYIKKFKIGVNSIAISKGKYDVAYNYYVTKLSNGLVKDVTLIKREYNGCSVRYLSLDENIITSDGQIKQTTVDQSTIMNIYVIQNGIAVLYPTEVTVLSFTAIQRIELTKVIVDQMIEDFQNGVITTLSTFNDEYGVTINWNSNIPEFFVLEDKVLTPITKTNVRLNCTLRYDEVSNFIEYELENVGGNMTEEEYITELVKYISKIELKGSINHLHKEYNDELFLDYQERINSYGVLNLAMPTSPVVKKEYMVDISRTDFKNKFFGSGTLGTNLKPIVGQNYLNEKFYEGYQMPNSSNVLWITVHESAMTLDGQTAEFLAKVQYRYAFEQNDARAASWNYQVDAYNIYQSFEDNVICWHAGDGTATPGSGNNNGIGIEMCVNQDGNYEGTLANNAKLVASLMLQYNLTLDNVKRHYDFSGKECPSYLIRTGRWEEFVEMVRKEYLIQKYLAGATIEYQLSTDTYQTTDEVLNNLFIEGGNGLWYNKPVSVETEVDFVIHVTKNGKKYTASSTIMLLPDEN